MNYLNNSKPQNVWLNGFLLGHATDGSATKYVSDVPMLPQKKICIRIPLL